MSYLESTFINVVGYQKIPHMWYNTFSDSKTNSFSYAFRFIYALEHIHITSTNLILNNVGLSPISEQITYSQLEYLIKILDMMIISTSKNKYFKIKMTSCRTNDFQDFERISNKDTLSFDLYFKNDKSNLRMIKMKFIRILLFKKNYTHFFNF